MTSLDSFKCRKKLDVGGKTYHYFSLKAAEKHGLPCVSELPISMKILLENLLRFEDGHSVTRQDIEGIAAWLSDKGTIEREIAFRPARVLMQDFTGVPAVVDLAAMRDAMTRLGGDPQKINPLVPVDLVIDHSVIVDAFGSSKSFRTNVELEYGRNGERYRFLKWGQGAFDNFRVVPPGTGICHQVNLEYLAQTVWTAKEKYAARGKPSNVEVAYPDTLVGTDSHTTMVNGLSVLGWGVGGIEAEACMLGQPLSMLLPEVIGFRLTGALGPGVTATDLVLTVTQMLRRKGVVGKFVEFCGPGLTHLSLADRATIANMAPECGATCNFFPIDSETLSYLATSARTQARVVLVEAYAKAQGLFRAKTTPDPVFTDTLELDLATVVPSMAGPKRPEGRVALGSVGSSFKAALDAEYGKSGESGQRYPVEGKNFDLGHGDVVIAAITSCTNTSNPNVLIGAGLLARNAVAKGIGVKPWVKTSLAPGSQVVAEYLAASGLQKSLDKLGFNLVGFGCTTCIGNSGPLAPEISKTINDNGIVAAAVLSGNRNFEGRINSDVQASYLASPPLVVAHALAGTVTRDLATEPIGHDKKGHPVFLKDIWPPQDEIAEIIDEFVTRKVFKARYSDVFKGDTHWRKVKVPAGETYAWDTRSTYVQNPPYFDALKMQPEPVHDIEDARILALFGDKITTDHISPAGAIKEASPAGKYLVERQVSKADFNQYGTRRGNHEIMMRGTFANIRIKNFILQKDGGAVPEGGLTKHWPDGEEMTIFDAAMKYQAEGVPARRLRRRRIRQWLVARLGGQGHQIAWGPRGHRRVLRAHSPFEPCRHGRPAAHLRARHELAYPWPQGRRRSDHPWTWRHAKTPPDDGGRHQIFRRQGRDGAAHLPHRDA